MKIASLLLSILLLSSCIAIKNKDQVLNLGSIGQSSNQLRLNGYYYHAKTFRSAPYFRNEYGGYYQDTTKGYEQIRIAPLLLNKDGSASVHGSFSGFQESNAFNFRIKCDLEEGNTLQNAFAYFECYIRAGERDNFIFINKKAEIWNQGVWKVSGDQITVQIYYNSISNYHLYEESGKILNDTTFVLNKAKDYETGKDKDINKIYQFRKMESLPTADSYILKNPKSFRNGKE